MVFYPFIHDLVFLLPPMYIHIGPAEAVTSVGLFGLIRFELRTLLRHG